MGMPLHPLARLKVRKTTPIGLFKKSETLRWNDQYFQQRVQVKAFIMGNKLLHPSFISPYQCMDLR